MLTRILVVDNHDSFVHTLIGYLQELGAEVTMVEADALDGSLSIEGSLSLSKGPRPSWGASTSSAAQAASSATPGAGPAPQAGVDGVMISPGPGTPADAGASIDMVHWAAARGIPLLGVCLGHQAIGAAFGMPVVAAPELMHGMVSQVSHDGSMLFDGIPSPFAAGRYHSLALDEADLPPTLRVTARTDAGTVMAIAHESLPIVGVQFHPESILTEHGHRLLGNWLGAYSPEQ